MKRIGVVSLVLLMVLASASLATSIDVNQVVPPKIILKGVKRIAVVDFEGGSLGELVASFMLEYILEPTRGRQRSTSPLFFSKEVQIFGKEVQTLEKGFRTNPYKIVERSRIREVIREQKFSTSDLVSEATAAKLGKILGVDAIVIGKLEVIGSPRKRTKYRSESHMTCTTITANLTATMRIINTSTAAVMRAESASSNFKHEYCGDNTPPPDSKIMSNLAKKVALRLVEFFTPSYKVRKIELVSKRDIRSGVKAAKRGDWDKAYAVFREAADKDESNIEALFNMGVCNEVFGNYDAALSIYQKVDSLFHFEAADEAIERCSRRKAEAARLTDMGMKLRPHEFGKTEMEYYLNCRRGKQVKLLTGAYKDAGVLGQIPCGMKIIKLETQGKFTKVRTADGKEGWVETKYLKEE